MNMKFKLNGKEAVWDGNPALRLLDVLRDDFESTGVKCGCKVGECGACSVLLDGKLTNSCMVAMGRAEGTEIVTIEGFKDTKRFEILDEAFADVSAVQCGYCIPAMILAGESVLAINPKPSEDEVRAGISGNLCRCTGYNSIVRAIMLASERGDGVW